MRSLTPDLRRNAPISRFSRIERRGNTLSVCGTKAAPISTRRCAGKPVTSPSLKRMVPLDTVIMPKIALSSVDLPAPLGPMIVTISPGSTYIEVPRTIITSP